MPGSPNTKIILSSNNLETKALGAATLEAILLRHDSLEYLQRAIADSTSPPANVSLSAISAAIAAMLP